MRKDAHFPDDRKSVCDREGKKTAVWRILPLLWNKLSSNHHGPQGHKLLHTHASFHRSWVLPSAKHGQRGNGLAYK